MNDFYLHVVDKTKAIILDECGYEIAKVDLESSPSLTILPSQDLDIEVSELKKLLEECKKLMPKQNSPDAFSSTEKKTKWTLGTNSLSKNNRKIASLDKFGDKSFLSFVPHKKEHRIPIDFLISALRKFN